MNKFKITSIFSAGIVAGVLAILSTGTAGAALPTPPFYCNGTCAFGSAVGNRFAGVDMKNAWIQFFQSGNGNFAGTNFKNAYFGQISSSGDNFTGANLVNIDILSGVVANGNFTGVNFTGATYTLDTAEGLNNYTNANFTNANLQTRAGIWQQIGSDTFTGTIWSNTICPDGTNSNNDGGTCIHNLNP